MIQAPPKVGQHADQHLGGSDDDEDLVGAMFASRSLVAHLIRGGLGLVLLVTGFVLVHVSAAWLLLSLAAVVAWRGCPTCWSIGLMAVLARRKHRE